MAATAESLTILNVISQLKDNNKDRVTWEEKNLSARQLSLRQADETNTLLSGVVDLFESFLNRKEIPVQIVWPKENLAEEYPSVTPESEENDQNVELLSETSAGMFGVLGNIFEVMKSQLAFDTDLERIRERQRYEQDVLEALRAQTEAAENSAPPEGDKPSFLSGILDTVANWADIVTALALTMPALLAFAGTAGIVIAAVGILGIALAAFYEMWESGDWTQNFITRGIDKWMPKLGAAIDWYFDIWWKILYGIADGWEWMAKKSKSAFDTIVGWFSNLGEAIKEALPNFVKEWFGIEDAPEQQVRAKQEKLKQATIEAQEKVNKETAKFEKAKEKAKEKGKKLRPNQETAKMLADHELAKAKREETAFDSKSEELKIFDERISEKQLEIEKQEKVVKFNEGYEKDGKTVYAGDVARRKEQELRDELAEIKAQRNAAKTDNGTPEIAKVAEKALGKTVYAGDVARRKEQELRDELAEIKAQRNAAKTDNGTPEIAKVAEKALGLSEKQMENLLEQRDIDFDEAMKAQNKLDKLKATPGVTPELIKRAEKKAAETQAKFDITHAKIGDFSPVRIVEGGKVIDTKTGREISLEGRPPTEAEIIAGHVPVMPPGKPIADPRDDTYRSDPFPGEEKIPEIVKKRLEATTFPDLAPIEMAESERSIEMTKTFHQDVENQRAKMDAVMTPTLSSPTIVAPKRNSTVINANKTQNLFVQPNPLDSEHTLQRVRMLSLGF